METTGIIGAIYGLGFRRNGQKLQGLQGLYGA